MTPTKRIIWAKAACFIVPSLVFNSLIQRADEARAEEGDRSCGPRCVRFVLERYGQTVPDFLKLVQEIQGGSIEKPATMAALNESLESRGIHCLTLHLGSFAGIAWNEPAIIHLSNGHFAVLCRSDGSVAEIWNEGIISTVAFADLRKRMSGYILLTSRTAIRPESAMAGRSIQYASLMETLTWLSGCAAILICVIVILKPLSGTLYRQFHYRFLKASGGNHETPCESAVR